MSESQSKASKPATPLWLLLVTLLGGAFLVQRGGSPPTDDKSAGPPPVAVKSDSRLAAASEDRMLAPLREFLGIPLNPGAGQEKGREELAQRIQSTVGLLEFLVVMVADPVETATNYRFDLQLDTLHKAMGAEGYVPDRYYLPWGSLEKANAHRDEPGVLLYRRNGESWCKCEGKQERIDVVLVYLVGETPTSGIHKEAFASAVKQIESLRKHSCKPASAALPESPTPDRTIRVAGPLFTGAADSLAVAIRQARTEKLTTAKFQAITGTAVSIDRERFMGLAGKGNADLHSTVLYGNILRQALIDHVLERTWARKVRFAWLTETGTGYGSRSSVKEGGSKDDLQQKKDDFQERQNRHLFMQNQMQTEQQAASPAKDVDLPKGDSAASTVETNPETPSAPQLSRAEVLEFRFPVNISKVRSGYAESRRRERSAQATLGPESSRLPIPFDDTSTARDVPPMQTPKVTSPTVELILTQILTTIRNEGIRYVGISSSDPRDPIFLAELIKEQCPDVQVMLVTSDLLHLHSEYRSIMHGTLVSSTHPLNPEAQNWCFPFGEEDQVGNARNAVLSSQSHYGLYNAIVMQRGLERGQYSRASSQSNSLQLAYSQEHHWPGGLPLGYSMPFQREIAGEGTLLRPPVWISRISPTGICPISVRPSNRKAKAEYTFSLNIAAPPREAEPLPALHIRSRIPASLFMASLAWLVGAIVYGAALLSPKTVGNWASSLTAVRHHPRDIQSLCLVFRSYISGSLAYVLIMFGTLMYVYHRWVAPTGWGDFLTVAQYLLCWGVATGLILCLLIDWGLVLGRLTADGLLAARGVIRFLRNRFAPASIGNIPPSECRPFHGHLIAVQIVGLVLILVLVAIHVSATIWQRVDWLQHKEDSFLWFKATSDMWNGLSPAMSAQLLAVALIILAYGMVLQIHMLSPDYTIIHPDLGAVSEPEAAAQDIRLEEMRDALVFPLLNRWRRRRPIVFDIFCVAAALAWLAYLGWNLQPPDYCALPASFPAAVLLVAGGFWCVRLFKLIQILKLLVRQLEDLTKTLRERWPGTWPKIFALLPEKRTGLQEIIWANRPLAQELKLAWDDFRATQAADPLNAEQKLCAIKIELYVRQIFHHIFRMGLGLSLSACLLFITVQAFPFSQEPMLRLSASVMLAVIGGLMVWYYLKFDRNELLSHLVGTDPKHISINWSLIQMIAPALLLTVVAVLSSTFPEIWQWVRGVLEPMSRSAF